MRYQAVITDFLSLLTNCIECIQDLAILTKGNKKLKQDIQQIYQNALQESIIKLESIQKSNILQCIQYTRQHQPPKQFNKQLQFEYLALFEQFVSIQMLQFFQDLQRNRQIYLCLRPIQQFSEYFMQLKNQLTNKIQVQIIQIKKRVINLFDRIEIQNSNALLNNNKKYTKISPEQFQWIKITSIFQQAKIRGLSINTVDIFMTCSKYLTPRIAPFQMDNKKFSLVYDSSLEYLKQLNLKNIKVDSNAFKIISMGQFTHLQFLHIFGVSIKNKGVESLVKAVWPKLKDLHLVSNFITFDTLKILLKGSWPLLKQLTLPRMNFSVHKQFNKYYGSKFEREKEKDCFYLGQTIFIPRVFKHQ